ncbi:hypothetical protein COY90_02165 [Candidatus Roizmanbacteria bacterium CG_4_10_14_0_8_um_filter_39_9]|uniref:Uncharacterized protein n=1 Tax=Candidatus Roizmanbacteria bacterium CG_4_10_14_0_8_um_filter_39_9 TaxID=1974829 RepID=A0A2M7QD44_9BACT|nr:MAG: hypothetical protein COY90_02165 [Candidatus Roizmanbacteria bacterium CG_4_10_14_0_8_um_filter_39_9]
MNVRILRDTLWGEYDVAYKLKLLFSLLKGMWTAMSGPGLTVLFLVALLTGANLTLLFGKVSLLKNNKNLRLVVGGNSLLGIVGSGCAACGLPILSLLGLSGSVMYLPFRGAEISYISLVLLTISFYMLIINSNQACTLEKNI